MPIKKILARTESVVIALTDTVAYPSGCQFGLQLAVRRVNMNDEQWRHRQEDLFGHADHGQGGVPGEVFRAGVQFSDGTKATNVDSRSWQDAPVPSAPAPPVFMPSGGGGDTSSADQLLSMQGFWLWPLPPPEPFTFAVEWPAYDVPLTMTELDGAVIVAASEAAEEFWPDATGDDHGE